MTDQKVALVTGITGQDGSHLAEFLLEDPTQAETQLGWKPTTTLDEMISEMVENDLKAACKNRLLINEGYEIVQTEE